MMEKDGILLAGKKIIKGLLVGSIVLASAQADFLMTLTDKAGVEENLCVKSYSFSNNLESLHKEVKQKDIYSTEETLTNKIYLGKPVYRKIVKMPNLISDRNWRYTPYENPPKNMDKLFDARIIGTNFSAMSRWGTSENSFVYRIDGDKISYRLGKLVNLNNLSIILEYIKTTDTAQTNTNELTTLVHYLPSDSSNGEYVTKSLNETGIRFLNNYTYDASTNSCIAPAN
ncbi:hypothetical protein [Arcobacter sp. F2176]|uniref:hypothetical protein n=1 Tax=Arcobacter sp. F2176 TaxID=2044511 RepID=UPI00100B85C8|nr:hypothetical protein [Arcobacter sp. F2176]RXJ80207.1 hypothetical protein CRU95_12055 [Arcobacter sp. F2176]